MDGWIKTYRSILTHPLWTCEPYTKGQAWIELLLLANHADNKMMINDNWVVIKRGQLHTSVLKLADRWKWSRGKVNRFLDVLKTDGMLNVECSKGGTTNGTTLTIVNYSVYQDSDTTDSTTNSTTDDTTHGTTNGQRTDINNNDNNDKKEKNEKNKIDIESAIFDFSPEVKDAIRRWVDYKKVQFRFTYKSDDSFKTFLKKLQTQSGNDNATIVAMVDQAIGNGWSGIYELKKTAQKPQPTNGHIFDGPGTYTAPNGETTTLGKEEYITANGERHYYYYCDGKRYKSEDHYKPVPYSAPARILNSDRTIFLRDGNCWGPMI